MSLTPSKALWALIVVSTGLRLLWASAIGLGNDEAYHYLYAIHVDWSYFDHPPMLMWVEQIGLHLFGEATPLALRFGFVMMFAGSTWVLFCWTARWYGAWAGFYAALALNLTAYYTAAAGAFVLPDGPLLFFALLTLWGLSEALIAEPGRWWPWIWVGLAWGGALLSKYHAVFLPAGALVYVLVTPGARRVLRAPGAYLATAIGLLAFTPVLVWNAQHNWVSFTFQAGRAVGWQFRPDSLLRTIGGQALYLYPWRWLELLVVLAAVVRQARNDRGVARLVACQALTPLVLFLAVSCVRPNLPHWSLLGFVPLFPALGARWAALAESSARWLRRRLCAEVAVTLLLAAQVAAHTRWGLLHIKGDPLLDMAGWQSVAAELDRRGLIGAPKTFLFTDRWYDSGHLGYAVQERAPVLCYNYGDARGFGFWSDPNEWLGRDGILVYTGERPDDMAGYGLFFASVDLVAEFPMTRHGHAERTVRVYRCRDQTRPFPFRLKDVIRQ